MFARTAILVLVGYALSAQLDAQSVSLSQVRDWGSGFQAFTMDPSTGKYYRRVSYSGGTTVYEFNDRAAWEAGSASRTFNLGSGGFYGTYFQASNGKLFGRTDSSSTAYARWATSNGAREQTVGSISGMCGSNGNCTYNWGGYSGVNFMHDGNGVYVFGRNSGNNNWQISRVNESNLSLSGTQQVQTSGGLGFGFMINGYVFTGDNYSQNSINRKTDVSNGQQQSVSFSLSGGPPSPYWSHVFYDPDADVVYFHDQNTSISYRIANAAMTFGVQRPGGGGAVPASSTVTMLITIALVLGAMVFPARRALAA
jgi:hypothetical protein